MTGGTVIVKGVVRGKTVELDREPGLPDGQLVSVVLRPALSPGEGLRRSFGAWAGDAQELERFLEDVYRDRDDERELANTREKLRLLEESYEELAHEMGDEELRDASMESLKRLINQLKEEIARYETRHVVRR
jgi:hypothetical protein